MRLLMEPAEERVVVEDVPDSVLDFFQPNVLAVQGVTEELLAGVEAKVPAVLTRRTSKCPGYVGGSIRSGNGRGDGVQREAGVASSSASWGRSSL